MTDGPVIVGISAHYHDAACAVLVGGRLVAAAQEERFSRVKQDPRIPCDAFRRCLGEAGLTVADIDCVAYYEDPAKKLDRQIWWTFSGGADAWLGDLAQLDAHRPVRDVREVLGFEGRLEIVDHHLSHAASAYYFSGFSDAAVLTVDAVGEWATTTWGEGTGDDLRLLEEIQFPHSLGLLYSAITGYLGFEVNDGEYKVMGLAPYGAPSRVDDIRKLIDVTDDGTFTLDLSYFDFRSPDTMTTPKLGELLGAPPRDPGSEITQAHRDIARSLQVVTEETLLALSARAKRLTPSDNLCMAGGVALNVVATRRIVAEGPFGNVFVQPAAGDAGGCLGAAAVAHRRITGRRPDPARMRSALLGPAHSSGQIAQLLNAAGERRFLDFRGRETDLIDLVADRLAAGQVIGWYQGRMEFGPRALGSRSILADPRAPDMRDKINTAVKKREAFRPFAPAVLAEEAAKHFRLDHDSPFMLETCAVESPLDLPAITHVDGSARVQTITEEANGRFYRLVRAFADRTGCPLVLNTSFNLRGEPIVASPQDALLCFLRSAIDCLVLEDFVIERSMLPESWLGWFEGTSPTRRPVVGNAVYTFL